ncbi:hypothetical protein CSA56_00210 [candidate division KSB3 bacterium]|uniref:Uncharacterized protein n=1 Tax=candidate division KSB3 bacterium TaxID=2044937 RepID=A0A2G6KLF8_9BACT|nr:MAG: hypothetical protein CSA56_00210 [candidate division KSB3 bacterium]
MPKWVHELLEILQERKLGFVKSLKWAQYNILGSGGGDASTIVISPKMFRKFVALYDSEIVAAAHVGLAEAKRQIGDRVYMIGGFDQGRYFERATEEETRAAVRECF